MEMHLFRWTCLLTVLIMTANWGFSQDATDVQVYEESDSLYIIQFFASRDTNRSFRALTPFGEIIKEIIPEKGVCRYNIGYFDTQEEASLALDLVRQFGYTDAFIRKTITRLLLPEELIPLQQTLPDSVVTTTPDTLMTEVLVDEGLKDWIAGVETPPVTQESPMPSSAMSIVYTGKSLGLLGNTRFQNEHELVTEYAIENEIEFKLVSHACWRTLGLTIFLPSDEPLGHELDLILDQRNEWEVLESYPALRTKNVILFEDLDRTEYDMLNLVMNNKRTLQDYPEIERVQIRLYRTYIEEDDKECLIIEEVGAKWPNNREHWDLGEINRVDFGKTGRLFELPSNQGNFASRVSVLKTLDSLLIEEDRKVIKADLGHRNGDFDVSPEDRARADIEGLARLGYEILLPFEFEISLGPELLKQLKDSHPELTWLATNINVPDSALFASHHVQVFDGVKIGMIGMIDPNLETNLPGSILRSFDFIDFVEAAQKEVTELLNQGVHSIVAFSNMSSDLNSVLAEQVRGIDVVVSDVSGNGTPFNYSKQVRLPLNQKRGLGRPYHIANNYDYGIAVGRVDLDFAELPDSLGTSLMAIEERNYPVNDRIESDTILIHDIAEDLNFVQREKGDLMFPAFIDIIEQQPKLEHYDDVTEHGRMSKALWEQFLANLLRHGAPAEVSMIRGVPSFLPLIGKLHEREVRSWLWVEDDVVLMDMKGRDLRRLIEADHQNLLVTSGISSFNTSRGKYYFVMGRFLLDDVFYRVATTNVISHGAMEEHFRWAQHVNDKLEIDEKGHLRKSKTESTVSLREFTLSELKRIRRLGKGKAHHKRIADILMPPTNYEKLFTFNFVRPTLWTSINRSYKSEGYESVPESRIISNNSFVIGIEGGVVMTLDKERFAWDLGTRIAFAQQSAEIAEGVTQTTETMDDINLNLTYRFKGKNRKGLHPFARIEYDSEFTSTFNPTIELDNPKQQIMRSVIGLSRQFSLKWPTLEFGVTAENDFARNHYQYGIQGRSRARFPLDKNWLAIYSLTNNFNYYFPTNNDTDRELSFRYNMVHEILVPLFGDLSLNVGADLFFFKGKTDINNKPGMSMLLRVGVTYNRLWKPRFQSLF